MICALTAAFVAEPPSSPKKVDAASSVSISEAVVLENTTSSMITSLAVVPRACANTCHTLHSIAHDTSHDVQKKKMRQHSIFHTEYTLLHTWHTLRHDDVQQYKEAIWHRTLAISHAYISCIMTMQVSHIIPGITYHSTESSRATDNRTINIPPCKPTPHERTNKEERFT